MRRGDRLPGDSISVPNPLIIVEVLSPSSRSMNRALKQADSFKLPSLHHYLIVWPDKQQIVHHRRGAHGAIETSAPTAGDIRLDPPGIRIAIEDVHAD